MAEPIGKLVGGLLLFVVLVVLATFFDWLDRKL